MKARINANLRMKKPKVCVLRAAGTNCDKETAFAFSIAGAEPNLVHINALIKRKNLSDYQILAIPGGFTYGDDIGAGKILANELKYKLLDQMRKFIGAGNLIIGICNGFQVLLKSGFLSANNELRQETSLIMNDSGKFEDRWVHLKKPEIRAEKPEKCIWVKNLPEIIYLPVAHGEGKFVAKDNIVLERLKQNGQIVFQYCNEKGGLSGYPYNPNGSSSNIAGICDETGRIFGLMPHPERYAQFQQHPKWTGATPTPIGSIQREVPNWCGGKKTGDGLQLFKNGVEYARKNLL